jgi:hypothetical protein
MAAEPPILSQALGFAFIGLIVFCAVRARSGRKRRKP